MNNHCLRVLKSIEDSINELVIEIDDPIKLSETIIQYNIINGLNIPEDYYFSSARNYAGLDNDLDVILLDLL